MQFENVFEVHAPVDVVYGVLLDVAKVAPCVPGAEVLDRTGDAAYKVGIKVKVGPIRMQYRGDVEIVDHDDSSHSATLRAKARETRGQGTADATVEMRLTGDSNVTKGTIVSDVKLSGRAASMGQGAIRDVSAALIDDFAKNLAAMLNGSDRETSPSGNGASARAEAPAADPDSDAESLRTSRSTSPPGEAARAAPAAESSISGLRVVRVVLAGRLRDPRVAGGTCAVLGFLMGSAVGRARG
jgi:carbon monoxide dehydrogenase subunit G